MSVYDDQNKDLDSLSPDELRDLEQQYSSRQDEKEDKAIEGGADPGALPNQGIGRKLRTNAQGKEADETQKLEDKIGSAFDVAKKADGDLYNPVAKGAKITLQGLTNTNKKKGFLFGAGGVLIALFIGLGSFFGFLNTFKLDHLMQNIEQRAFMRYMVSMDGRSSKWIQAYMTLRLSEIEGGQPGSLANEDTIFRSDRVDNNDPLTDWYKTMRTSKFEKDLADKHGIKFASVAKKGPDGTIRIRPAVVTINNKPIEFQLTPEERKNVENFDINSLNGRLREFVEVDAFNSDKEARRAIKKAVNDETRSWQVIKRRHIRKNIQNMTGVRDWRFFENTRDKIDEKKIGIRNKIIIKAMPESTKSGKFIQCLFGIVECKSSSDVLNSENRDTSADTTGKERSNGRSNPTDPNAPNPDLTGGDAPGSVGGAFNSVITNGGEDVALAGIKAAFVKQVVSKVSGPLGVVSMIDSFSRIDKAVGDGTLTKMVVAAKSAQAMGMFTTYMIARDQMKTGEVTNEEVNQLMQTVNNVSASEAYTKVIAPQTNIAAAESFVAAKDKQEFCSTEHQAKMQRPENRKEAEKEFQYLCDNLKIGGGSNAKNIEDWWNNSIGVVLRPFLNVYRNTIGVVFDTIFSVISAVTGPAINAVLSATGLDNKIEELVGWITGEISTALGAGPMLNGTEPSGTFTNVLTEGGAASAEGSARFQGASLTTKQSKIYNQAAVAAALNETAQSQSNYDKYISLDNPTSVASNALFNATEKTNTQNGYDAVTSTIASIKNIPFSLFAGKTKAADSQDPYAAANFSGIATYDFPQQCIDLDPLTMKPEQATNGAKWFSSGELTWDLLRDNTKFNDTLYEKVSKTNPNDTDEVMNSIYNCGALDATVSGGLGYMYGYTNDNGLEEKQGDSSNSNGDNLPIECQSAVGNQKIACAAQQAFGYPYPYFDHVRSNCIGYDGGYIGYPGSAWVKLLERSTDKKTIDGKNICIGCSGFVNVALYRAFGIDLDYTSNQFYRNDKNFKTIPLKSVKPGDLLIKHPNGDPGSNNHVAIVESYDPATNKLITVESSAGNNAEGKALSGRYTSRNLTEDFEGASRYIGKGSDEQP